MTIQELKDLVRLKIAGQGTMVDAGGALPPVLNGILDTLAATQNVESVVVTMDGGEGTPSADATFADGVLTLAFHNLKGEKGDQGNTGSSVDYPFELVNNVTTDDATKALSAAQGVVLDGKISQLGQEMTDFAGSIDASIGGEAEKMILPFDGYIDGSFPTAGGGGSTNLIYYDDRCIVDKTKRLSSLSVKVNATGTLRVYLLAYSNREPIAYKDVGVVPGLNTVDVSFDDSLYTGNMYVGILAGTGLLIYLKSNADNTTSFYYKIQERQTVTLKYDIAYAITCYDISNTIREKIEQKVEKPGQGETTYGYFGFADGKITRVNHLTIKRGVIPCKMGDYIYLFNLGGNSARAWYITDSSENILAQAEEGADYATNPEIIQIEEENASFVFFNTYPYGNGEYGDVIVQSRVLSFMTKSDLSVQEKAQRGLVKFDSMHSPAYNFVNTNDGFSEGTKLTVNQTIKVSSPILNPILFTFVCKGTGNIYASYESDEESNFQQVYTQRIQHCYFECADYEVKEELLPPFLFNAGQITIRCTTGIKFRIIELSECFAPRINRGNILMAAHLGYLLGYNTMPGFQMASKMGFRACVANLRNTADGELVCAHDNTFTASTDGQSYTISSKTYAEIESLGYQENGNTNAQVFYVSAHLVKVEEFLRHCSLTGMYPILSVKKDVDYTILRDLIRKYGFDTKDGITFKAASLTIMSNAYAVLGNNVRYMYDFFNKSTLTDELDEWVNLVLEGATKAIELAYPNINQQEVTVCKNTGMVVSYFDSTFLSSQYYKTYMDWGVTEFTTDNMVSSGFNWY